MDRRPPLRYAARGEGFKPRRHREAMASVVNAEMVNAGGLEFLPAAKTANFREFARKS